MTLGNMYAFGLRCLVVAACLVPISNSWGQSQSPSQSSPDTWFSGWSLSDKIAAIASAVAFLQFAALLATIGVTARNGRRQLRAYVFVSSAKIVDGIDNDQIPEAQVVVKNSGQTPAYGLINVSGIAVDKYPPTSRLKLSISKREFSAPGRSKMDLPPGDVTVPITPAPRALTREEKANLAAGTGVMFAYGEIRYRDAFGRRRWTKYRFMTGRPVGVRGGHLAICEEGNEAN